MLKKIVILFFISTNCFAQNNLNKDQVGMFFAECSAYMMHANIWNTKLGDIAAANQFRENMGLSMDIANKLIGKTRASDITVSTSKVIGSHQSNSDMYLKYIFNGVKKCSEFSNRNNASIAAMLK